MFGKREYSQDDSGAVKPAGFRSTEKLLMIVPLLALIAISVWQFRASLPHFGGASNVATPPANVVAPLDVTANIITGKVAGGENSTVPTATPTAFPTDKPERFFPVPDGDMRGVSFSQNDRFLAIQTLRSWGNGSISRVAVWDVVARKKLLERNLGDGSPYCVLSPDGATLAVMADKSYGDKTLGASASAYDVKSGRKLFQRFFARNSLQFAIFAFSPDGTKLSLPSQPPLWLDARSGEIARTFQDAGDDSCVVFLGETRYAVLKASGKFARDNKAFHFLPPEPQPYANLKTAPTTVHLFDAKTHRLIATLPQHDAFWCEPMPRTDAFFTATLAACDGKKFFDGKVRLWDAKTGAPGATISQTSTNCVFSNDNAQAFLIAPRFAKKPAYSASTLMLYDLATQRVLWKRELPFTQYEIAFTPDGKSGAMTRAVPDQTPMQAHREIEVFSLRDGKTKRTITLGYGSNYAPPPLSPGGTWLFDAGNNGVSLWRAS